VSAGQRGDLLVFALGLVVGLLAPLLGGGLANSLLRTGGLVPLVIALALLLVLAPAAAILGRRGYHARRRELAARRGHEEAVELRLGCLFSPVLYFCVLTTIWCAVNAGLLALRGAEEPAAAEFLLPLLGGMVLVVVHTALAYRYFSPPQRPPRWAFLSGPLAWRASRVLFGLNLLTFGVLWNLLTPTGPPPSGPGDVLSRLAVFTALALLLYFPPRMFTLVDDLAERRSWATIALAIAPAVARFTLGWG